VKSRTASPRVGVVNQIVVNQDEVVQELQRRGGPVSARWDSPRKAAVGEQEQHGPQPLSPSATEFAQGGRHEGRGSGQAAVPEIRSDSPDLALNAL
jgi:hypothetical protein